LAQRIAAKKLLRKAEIATMLHSLLKADQIRIAARTTQGYLLVNLDYTRIQIALDLSGEIESILA
jgi:hypothetical protein